MNHPQANSTTAPVEAEENRRILCVDDEQNVLDGLERILFEDFEVQTAPSAAEALELIDPKKPFAVIVSDMRMPKMDGAEFLKRARARVPDTMRILLTGQADMNSAISAVNDGHIFRFLWKPCPQETLVQALEAAVKQYRMITREHELLENTLMGAVNVLMDVLSMASPIAFSRASNIKDYVSHMARRQGLADQWIYKLAATLSQLGCITLPTDTLDKIYIGQQVSEKERKMYDDHPLTGARLLAQIPRMEEVAEIVRNQRGASDDATVITRIGADMLHTALAIDHQVTNGMEIQWAINTLRKEGGFNPELLENLMDFKSADQASLIKAVKIAQLKPDMILDEPVCTSKGAVVLAKGEKLQSVQITRLINFSQGTALKEPVNVRLPAETYLNS